MEKENTNMQSRVAELLLADINEANKNISHEEFSDGMKNGTIGFKVMFGEPSQLISGARKTVFNILVMLYMIAPFIIVPILSYNAGNWWLLFGIAFSHLFTRFAAWKGAKHSGKWKATIIIYFGIFCIGYWFISGFHIYDYITFFFFCSLWGHLLFLIAESSQNNYAMQMLSENSELFNSAVANNKIMVIHKDKEDKKKTEEMNQEKSSIFLTSGEKKIENGDYNGAIIEYSKAIEFYPFVNAYENRGYAKMKLKDYRGAIIDYTDAIKRMPSIPDKNKFANIYRNRGEAKRALNLINEAQLDFIEADKLINK